MKTLPINDETGRLIRAARLKAGLTLAELAERIGTISLASISKYERGRTIIPVHRLAELASVLDLPLERCIVQKKAVRQGALAALATHRQTVEQHQTKNLEDDLESAEAFVLELYHSLPTYVKAAIVKRLIRLLSEGESNAASEYH